MLNQKIVFHSAVKKKKTPRNYLVPIYSNALLIVTILRNTERQEGTIIFAALRKTIHSFAFVSASHSLTGLPSWPFFFCLYMWLMPTKSALSDRGQYS